MVGTPTGAGNGVALLCENKLFFGAGLAGGAIGPTSNSGVGSGIFSDEEKPGIVRSSSMSSTSSS